MKLFRTFTLGLAIGVTTSRPPTHKHPTSPTAPLPSALAKATKLFIGNA